MNEGNLQREWEAILAQNGMPAEIPDERNKAKREGVELISLDTASPDAQAIETKLKEEDPTNVFGGFPSDEREITLVIKDLQDEWLKQGVKPEEIKVAIHSSCENGSDCVVVSHLRGNKYHYNTAHIIEYSREKMLELLDEEKISYAEK